jgi:uncharacterized protein (TIGR02611 family)
VRGEVRHELRGAVRPLPGSRAHRWERWRASAHALRERIRADPRHNLLYRVLVGLVGAAVVVLGLVLVPLPGPGWLVVFVGLAVLGSEFWWARRLHLLARRTVHRWTQWVARRSWAARSGLGVVAAVVVVGALWGWVAWQGLPAWSPDVVAAHLDGLPGL